MKLMVDWTKQKKKCLGTVKSTGKECRGYAIMADGFCIMHSPLSKQKMIEAARKGGLAPKLPLPQIKHFKSKSSKDVKRYADHLMSEVVRGRVQMHPRDVVALMKVYLDIEQKSDVQVRLEKLEKARGQKNK